MQTFDLIKACRTLFENHDYIDSSFFKKITIEEVKSAYKKAVFKYHPDMFIGYPQEILDEKKQHFIKVVEAYELLIKYIMGRDSRRNYSSSLHEPQTIKPQPRETKSYNHQGRYIPKRNLKFSEFLYYHGVIDWDTFIKSINWQRKQRDRIGEIAIRWRYIDYDGLEFVLMNKKPTQLTGEVMLKHSIVTPFQLKSLLYQQRKEQPKIGEFFIINKILSPKDLNYYLSLHQIHNEKFPPSF